MAGRFGGALLPVNTALAAEWDRPGLLMLEVHSYVDANRVRGIAM